MSQQYSIASRYEIIDRTKEEAAPSIAHATTYFNTFPEAYDFLMKMDNRKFHHESADRLQSDQVYTSAGLLNRSGDFMIGKRLVQQVPDVMPDGIYVTVNWQHPEWKKHAAEIDLSWSATNAYSWSRDKYLLETLKDIKLRTGSEQHRHARRPSVQNGEKNGQGKKI